MLHMGNSLSNTSDRLAGASELLHDPSLHYECSLGSSRFLRAIRAKHTLGSLVIKTFIKPDPNMRLRALMHRLTCACSDDCGNAIRADISGARSAGQRTECVHYAGSA